jgi:hypothetical protein
LRTKVRFQNPALAIARAVRGNLKKPMKLICLTE